MKLFQQRMLFSREKFVKSKFVNYLSDTSLTYSVLTRKIRENGISQIIREEKLVVFSREKIVKTQNEMNRII